MRQISICLGCCCRRHIAFALLLCVAIKNENDRIFSSCCKYKPMFNLKINEKHENKRRKLITVLLLLQCLLVFYRCSNDATITGLDEGALPELASDTRAVITDELIESDSISNFSLLAATEYSDAELKNA